MKPKFVTFLSLLAISSFAHATDPAGMEKIELQGSAPITYKCEDNKTVIAQYFNSEDTGISMVKMTLDSKTNFLPQVVSASGARYTTNMGIEWWTNDDEALLNYDVTDDKSKTTTCREQK